MALLETLKTFETAEDFLEHFGVEYEQRVIDVHRLHILQRLHDRLHEKDLAGMDDAALHETYSTFLERAYQDFLVSDARTEKVFKVFQQTNKSVGGKTIVSLDDIKGVSPPKQ